MTVTIRSSGIGELAAHPELVQQAGTATVVAGTGAFIMPISTLSRIVAAADAERQLKEMVEALRKQELLDDDYDENEEMVSLRTDVTGVDNVVFVSPRGRAKHGPRIKIAIDPPQSLNPDTDTASMSRAIRPASLRVVFPARLPGSCTQPGERGRGCQLERTASVRETIRRRPKLHARCR